ncbi:MAG: DNA-protecting protein DprA [Clostridia bacterium]|nr:DNA-protecting protein DprA [Clostridia bacterium]
MYTEEEINLIVLCSFPELTYQHRYELLSRLESATPDFTKNEDDLIKSVSDGVYNKVKENFFSPGYRAEVLKGLDERGITCVTVFSENYPELLKEIDTPPLVLYCKGNLNLLNTRCFAVVGSRRTPAAMLKECNKISKQLSSAFTVVTGLADGADSAAIEGALASGKVISVLAYGFDYVYPACNKSLLKKVENKGLVITEFTPQTKVQKHLFPIRNRIIAGLSDGVLVVSAGKKSGALITAACAYEYGRDIFAFPYGIGVTQGEGCNSLIKKHGGLAENILDIFSQYGLDFKEPEKEALSSDEKAVLELVRESGEAFVAALAEKLGKQPYQVLSVLMSLEVKGKVVNIGGNRYSAV